MQKAVSDGHVSATAARANGTSCSNAIGMAVDWRTRIQSAHSVDHAKAAYKIVIISNLI